MSQDILKFGIKESDVKKLDEHIEKSKKKAYDDFQNKGSIEYHQKNWSRSSFIRRAIRNQMQIEKAFTERDNAIQ